MKKILLIAGMLTCLLSSMTFAQEVFINEIHYDNSGADAGEGIEIAGPAGTDLSGWSIALYNGSNGELYNTVSLSGTISDLDSGFGAVFFAIAGIQNGSPDGVALINGAANVVQFLSYEGTLIAVGGPADGLSSTDIGVAEASTSAIGFSLQLGGTGTVYTDFVWEGSQASTVDLINVNQSFGSGGGGGNPVDTTIVNPSATSIFINEIHYDNAGGDLEEGIEIAGPSGTDLAGWTLVLYNGSNGTAYNTVNLTGTIADQQSGIGTLFFAVTGLQNGSPDGIALVNAENAVQQFLSYEGAFTAVGGVADGIESEDIGVSEASSTEIGFSLQLGGVGSVYEDFIWEAASVNTYNQPNTNQEFVGGEAVVFINELHYDNTGADLGEGVELAGTAGTDLAGWSLVLYNGSNGLQYNVVSLSGTITNQDNGFGTIFFPVSGLQNGSPDGVALVNDSSEVVQFLSYEGQLTALDGPANTLLSEDIGVSESSGAAVGTSLQLVGTGRAYIDFVWEANLPETYNAINTGQSFGGTVIDTTGNPQQLTILAARGSALGTKVTITGVLTATDQFGGPAFIEDNTGGIAVFDNQVHGDGLFSIGDSLKLTGSIGAFNLQVQLVDVDSIEVLTSQVTPVTPLAIALSELGAEEGRLVTISNVLVTNPTGVFLPNRNYTLQDSLGNTATVRIDSNIDLVGRLIPEGSFDVTGVIGSFRGTPQLLPRFKEDVPAAEEFVPGGGISADSTFDVVTWNMEFFGATIDRFGPQDVALQLTNATTIVSALESDIIAVQEVSDENALQVLADSIGYESICSDRGSFSFDPDPNFPNQSLCYIYNPATVTVISERAIFESTYDSARAGLTNILDGYPNTTGAQGFWASGRLPYLLTADVTILGVTERVNLINIHGNSGAADLNKRLVDFGALKDTLDTYFAEETVILLGDYNDDVDESIAGAGVASPYASLITDSENYLVTTESLSLRGFNSFINGDEMIDHIAITNEFFDEFIVGSEATFLPFNLVDNYVNTTSDHLPVVSRFLFQSVPVAPLSGNAVCSEGPATLRNWEIVNPNDFAVTIDYAYGAAAGTIEMQSGANLLTTSAETGELTISWLDEQSVRQELVIAASDLPCIDTTLNLSIERVVSFDQGRRRNNFSVSYFRSNPDKALEVYENRIFNFVSLGFGGELVLEVNRPFLDQSGADFKVVETTFGWKGLPCYWYPEKAEIFASKFGVEFVSLGEVCLDGEVDLADGKLDWAQFIKIVDISDKYRFSKWADGYDVDGIQFLGSNPSARTEQSAFNNEAPNEDIPFFVEVYPNPAKEAINLTISNSSDAPVAIQITDQSGKIVYQNDFTVAEGSSTVTLDIAHLRSGLYHIVARTAEEVLTTKIVKQ